MPNLNLLYGFNLVNGYSPIWLKDYNDLTTFEANGVASKEYELLANQKILSLLSTKYIITSDKIHKGFLQTLSTMNAPHLIVEGFDHDKWDFLSSSETKDGYVILQSDTPGQVSMVITSFALQSRTAYKVTFQIRSRDGIHQDAPLIVDLFGDNYDSPEQEVWLTTDELFNRFQDVNVEFYSGKTVPPLAYLRFFTLSTQPYEIRNVRLIQNGNMPPNALPVTEKTGYTQIEPLYNVVHTFPDGIVIYENPSFLPRARFVKKIIVVDSSKSAINLLWNIKKFNPSAIALVEDYSGPTELVYGEVIDVNYSKESNITMSVQTDEKGFLVLSDTWYPGWKAYVDNKETRIYKTNAVSRGILITGAGEHTVEFQFVPKSFYMGLVITGITLAGFVLYYFLIEYKSKINKLEGN